MMLGLKENNRRSFDCAGPSTAQVAKGAPCFAQDDNYIVNNYKQAT
jgi:hypothetical protein